MVEFQSSLQVLEYSTVKQTLDHEVLIRKSRQGHFIVKETK